MQPSASAQPVLGVAVKPFSQSGYDGTSLQQIADRVGVTKAELCYHFRTKTEILTELVRPAFHDLAQQLGAATSSPGGSRRRDQALRNYVDYLLRHRPVIAFISRDFAAVSQPEVWHPAQALDAWVRR